MKHKWKLAAGLVATLAVLAVAVLAGRGPSPHALAEAQLAQALADLNAADPGWRLAEMVAAHNASLPPAEVNAADQLRGAAKLLPPSYSKWNGSGPASNHLPDAEAARALLALHAECGLALEVARRVIGLPGGGSAVVLAGDMAENTIWPAAQGVSTAAPVLAIEAAALAYQNRPAEARGACRGLVNAASGGVGTEPSSLSMLTRTRFATLAAIEAERVLAWTDSPEGLAELQARFAEERAAPRLLISYRSQRGALMQLLGAIHADPAVADTYVSGQPPHWTAGLVGISPAESLRRSMPAAQLDLLRRFGRLIESAAKSDGERAAGVAADFAESGAAEATLGERKGRLEGEGMVQLFLAGNGRLDQAESRVRARLGCAEVALACERFRHKLGYFPTSLAELPPDLLAAVPPDPYTGEPLSYRREPDGATVFAAGPKDAGGSFRLWNPAARRAAPLPAAPPEPAPPADPE